MWVFCSELCLRELLLTVRYSMLPSTFMRYAHSRIRNAIFSLGLIDWLDLNWYFGWIHRITWTWPDRKMIEQNGGDNWDIQASSLASVLRHINECTGNIPDPSLSRKKVVLPVDVYGRVRISSYFHFTHFCPIRDEVLLSYLSLVKGRIRCACKDLIPQYI